MKKFISILSIFLMVAAGSRVVAVPVATEKFIPLIVAEETKIVNSQGYNDIEVSVLHIPMQQINLPEGPISIKLNRNANALAAREYKKVDIFVNSKYQRSIGVPVQIKVFQNILVAKGAISKDTVLSHNNVDCKRYDVLSLVQNALDEKTLDTEIIATKMYRPGEIIDRRFSKVKPDVIKNTIVTVLFKTDDDMAVTVEGTALTEGSIGGMVSVQNKTYNKVYIGKVIGTNKVLVQI